MKTFFQHANVVDGTGQPAYEADVLVENERILKIFLKNPRPFGSDDPGTTVENGHPEAYSPVPDHISEKAFSDAFRADPETRRVDLSGKVLAPGFIDCHSHNDWFYLRKDGQERFFDTFIAQGITTMVTGNCGFSATGFHEDSSFVDALGGELFHLEPYQRHASCAGWLDAVDGNCPVNAAMLLGHGTARTSAAGMKADLTPEEEKKMLEVLEQGLQEGAAGISLGLMYQPGIFAPTAELEKVAALCAKYDRILTVHPRAESALSLSYSPFGRSHLLRAIDELDQLTRTTVCRFEHSHLIFVGRRTWKDVDEALRILEDLEKDGFSAGFDMYPLHYGASVITVILPDWYQKMDREMRRKPGVMFKLRIMIAATAKLLGFGFDDIRLAYAGEKHPDYNGRLISEIAASEGRKPFEVYIEVCEDSDFKARVLMGSYQNDAIVDRLMRHPMSTYMTDAWFEEKGIQNGSIYGAFPMFLRLSREKNIPIEEAVHKMTGKTAERFQLPERGFIREGYFADLVVLDPDRVSDGEKEDSPPVGIEQVYVNGTKAFDAALGGFQTERRNAGRGIRVGGSV